MIGSESPQCGRRNQPEKDGKSAMINATDFANSTRRHFLGGNVFGLAELAGAWLLNHRLSAGSDATPIKPPLERPTFDLLPKAPPRPATADAMISIFMEGGPSHLDMLDPKPQLAKYDGKLFPRDDVD
jgi:hypothetical protein